MLQHKIHKSFTRYTKSRSCYDIVWQLYNSIPSSFGTTVSSKTNLWISTTRDTNYIFSQFYAGMPPVNMEGNVFIVKRLYHVM